MDDVWILRDLLQVPSPSGDEGAACRVFAEHARQLGFRVTTDAVGNVEASMGSGRPRTMFLGHIDTVPGFWPVRIEDKVIHGRGAVDAKGPLVAGLLAAARLGDSWPGTRVVVAAVGEETDSRGARELVRHPPPDAVIVGEPSGWDRVTIGFRGRRTGTFRAVRAPSHPSSPASGTLDQAVDVASRVREFVMNRTGTGLFDSVTCRLVRWVHSASVTEESTEFEVDVRGPPGFEWEALERIGPRISWSAPIEAVVVRKGNPAVRALVEGVRACGGRPSYLLKGGTSDMNWVAPAWPVAMVSYGPGDPTLDHGPSEHLSIEEFGHSIDALTHAFERLGKTLPPEPSAAYQSAGDDKTESDNNR